VRPAGSITRRSVLAGSLATVAACSHPHPRSTPPKASPDAASLAQARAGEAELIAVYDAAIVAARGRRVDTLTTARDAHAAHLAALAGTSTPAPTATLPPFSEIDALLRGSAASLRTFAVSAAIGGNAAVFASIAASHEVSTRG
jgi:hypothetical protein